MRQKQMPRQNGSYIVKVKNGAGWRAHKTARLQISVGMPYHEDEKFRVTAEWAAQRFDRVIVCVNDTLQRFNLMYDGSFPDEGAAARECLRRGREWVARNYAAIEKLPDFSLHHWDEWKQRPGYGRAFDKVTALYRDNTDFRASVEKGVGEFWDRHLKKEPQDTGNAESFAAHSTRYLLEETAVFSLMYAQDAAADIYPGTLLVPMRFLKDEDLIRGNHHTRIDFARRDAA